MRVDTYTKLVLTVIAVCLIIICLRDIDIVQSAAASTSASGGKPMPVALYARVSTIGSGHPPYAWVPVDAVRQGSLEDYQTARLTVKAK